MIANTKITPMQQFSIYILIFKKTDNGFSQTSSQT